jgi:hypothetical protein
VPRGVESPVGTETVNKNGYTSVKMAHGGWKAKHVMIMEQKLKRELELGEHVIFKDGNQQNFDPNNLELRVVGSRTEVELLTRRITRLSAKVDKALALVNQLARERDALYTELTYLVSPSDDPHALSQSSVL